VKVSSREALTYGPNALNSFGLTFRAFRDPVLGYHAAQWDTTLISIPAPVPTITAVSPADEQVAAGNVVITGTSFGGVSAVTFGGVPAASFTINSATQITAVMPAGAAGSADIVVTNSGGASTAETYDRV